MPDIVEYLLDGHIEYAGFISDLSVFATANGTVQLAGEVLEVHNGLLAATLSLDGKKLITGGEDGKVLALDAAGLLHPVGEMKGKWVDKLAAGPQESVAFASGRTIEIALADGTTNTITLERSAEGLAFAPKGMRIAVARYNGVSLYWATTKTDPVTLEWDGAHTGVTFSPNGKFVVTTMQENALHGWRLDNRATGDGKHMRMTGYPAKVKSISWSPKGKWLATSGAPAAILWPFSGRDGPMGKAPKELGSMGEILVTQVACHPSEDVVAIGYGDGMIMAVRIEDQSEAVLRKSGKASISSLNWDTKGLRLAYGSEEGEAGIITIGG